MKKYGIDKVLTPVVEDINKLYEGYRMKILQNEILVFGKVLMYLGDTLGKNLWGGFKEGVGVSKQKCRHCYCEFNDMQLLFREDLFVSQTKLSYEAKCLEIENAETETERSELQKNYGINKRSYLTNVRDFDIATQLPQDTLHTLLESSLQYELRILLLSYIKSREFTLEDLNYEIINFDFGYSEIGDKFGPLHESVFTGDERYKLKYNAAQSKLFLRLLRFLLSNFVDQSTAYCTFLIQIVEICQILFSPVISKGTVTGLEGLTEEHLKRFKQLFSDKNITLKQHYVIHNIPSHIILLGLQTRASCFSFESAHKYFKELARKQNFKNLPFSLAKRH